MLEQLRREMIQAFHDFSKGEPMRREPEWEAYIRCRERFLALNAKIENLPYKPLKPLNLGGEH